MKSKFSLDATTNICKLYGYFYDFQHIYLIQEYSGGEKLYHLLQTQDFAPEDIKSIFNQVAAALRHLHGKGYTHRDLKPENILWNSKKKRVVLTDFGVPSGGCRDSYVGTVDYLAPEIIKRRPYGKEVDAWSLGILLYKMTYGETPWIGSDEDKIKNQIPEPDYPIVLEESAPEQAIEFMEKLIVREPDLRTVTEFQEYFWV